VANFNGVNQYLSRADGGAANWADIRGTETYIAAAQRGLTVMCWFNTNNIASAPVMVSKFNSAGAQRSYILYITAVGGLQFYISPNGAAATTVTISTVAASTWTFGAGVFVPSTLMRVYMNDSYVDNAVAIPASVFDSTAAFAIGAVATPANYFNGSISMVALCAAACSPAQVLNVYQQTRALFGV